MGRGESSSTADGLQCNANTTAFLQSLSGKPSHFYSEIVCWLPKHLSLVYNLIIRPGLSSQTKRSINLTLCKEKYLDKALYCHLAKQVFFRKYKTSVVSVGAVQAATQQELDTAHPGCVPEVSGEPMLMAQVSTWPLQLPQKSICKYESIFLQLLSKVSAWQAHVTAGVQSQSQIQGPGTSPLTHPAWSHSLNLMAVPGTGRRSSSQEGEGPCCTLSSAGAVRGCPGASGFQARIKLAP